MLRRPLLIADGSLVAAGALATAVTMRGMGTQADFNDEALATRVALPPEPAKRDLVRFATLAPNGHNTQPGRFAVEPGRIDIRPDLSRRTPVVDPDDHHIFVSLMCAAENLALAATGRGFHGEPAFDNSSGRSIVFPFKPAPRLGSALFEAIPHRHSTGAHYDGHKVSANDLATLAAAGVIPGVDMALITDRPDMDRIRDLVVAGNTMQMADPAFMRELKSWLRFSARHAMETGDGLFSLASGSPALPEWLGPYAFDMVVSAASEKDRYTSQIRSSSGVAVFVGARDDREHWVQVGRAPQRFALQATALGLKHAYINQPVEVPSLRPEPAALVGMAGRRPDIDMRFGHGPQLPYSIRRPVAAVLET